MNLMKKYKKNTKIVQYCDSKDDGARRCRATGKLRFFRPTFSGGRE